MDGKVLAAVIFAAALGGIVGGVCSSICVRNATEAKIQSLSDEIMRLRTLVLPDFDD